jgi:7-cyano-7-deazaguanine synthase
MDTRVVAIVSGGMDSITLAHHLNAAGHELHLVSFDYGQRHGSRELEMAAKCAIDLGADHSIVAMPDLAGLIRTSALTSDAIDVPDGHYAEDTMKATVVPNRNMVMLSIAGAIAVAEQAYAVATGVHAGDHFIYPDCRPVFIDSASIALRLGNQGFAREDFTGIVAPFVRITKAEIVTIGDRLGVRWVDTWSCYKGGIHHCGRCGTCVERQEAFSLAGVADPTTYVDAEFWKSATA